MSTGAPRARGTKASGKSSGGGSYASVVSSGATFAGVDQGIDFTGDFDIYALDDAVIKTITTNTTWIGGHKMIYQLTAGPHKGDYIYVAEAAVAVSGLREGDHVKKGQTIAKVNSSYPGTEIGWATASGMPVAPLPPPRPANQWTKEGQDFHDFATGQAPGGTGVAGDGSGSGAGGGGNNDGVSNANAAANAFATFIDLPGILDTAESVALRGEKSLMNDKPLFPFVEQLCAASLRNFMSLPNGDFFAFYPDYFGGLQHRTPYWEISDIEIIDATINLSDDALATHVYVVGDIVGMDGVNLFDRIQSGGVVTIFNAFMADFLNGLPPDSADQGKTKKEEEKTAKWREKHPNLANKNAATDFLKRYGARPYYEEAPMVRSPYYEAFLAYQRFCLMWSRQFLTTFEFTFMPELFPGGIVAFPDHGIQCYVDEVVHECDYERGFSTRANLSAPAAIRDAQGQMPEGKQFISAGMIRGFAID
jgi:hypothetical protein